MGKGDGKRLRPPGSGDRVISIVDRIEQRQLAALRRRASKTHAREIEVAVDWLDWKKQLESTDIDAEIARVSRGHGPEAQRDRGVLRCLQGLQRCLKGDVEAGQAEWAAVAAELPELALPHVLLARWTAQADPRGALPHYDHAAELEPRDANIYWRRGECHGRLGDHERALANYRTALALDPHSIDGLHATGKALLSLGRPAEALRYLDEVISRAPKYVEFHMTRAIALELTGEQQAAVRDYDRVLELDPANGVARYCRAKVRGDIGEVDPAIEELTALAAEEPEVGIIQLTLGKTLFKAERFEAAKEALARAAELSPGEHEAWSYLGIVRMRLGDREGALADVERAIEIAPDRIEYVFALVSIRHAEDTPGLIAALAEPIARFPEVPIFLEERAEAYERESDAAHALADWEALLAKWPESDDFRRGRARCLVGLGRTAEALEEAELLVASDPTSGLAHGLRAHFRHLLGGDDALVVADWARALELTPDEVATVYHHGLYLLAKNQYAAALTEFDRVVSLAPALAEAYYQRGFARYRLDEEHEDWEEEPEEIDARFGACIDDFERAIELGYEDEDVYSELYSSYFCVERDDEALAALDRGLARDPRSHNLLMWREDLRRQLGDEAGAEADRILREEIAASWNTEAASQAQETQDDG